MGKTFKLGLAGIMNALSFPNEKIELFYIVKTFKPQFVMLSETACITIPSPLPSNLICESNWKEHDPVITHERKK